MGRITQSPSRRSILSAALFSGSILVWGLLWTQPTSAQTPAENAAVAGNKATGGQYDLFQTARRSWHRADNDQFVAAVLLWARGDQLRFLTSDGRLSRGVLDQLSPADRQFVREHRSPVMWRTWTGRQASAAAPAESLAVLVRATPMEVTLLDASGGRQTLLQTQLAPADRQFVAQVVATGRQTLDPLPPAADSAESTVVDDGSRRPFARLYFSEDFLAELLGGQIERPTTVADNILGAEVRGTGVTRGNLTVQTRPCEEGVLIDLILRGVAYTQTVSSSGPARIHSSNTTQFAASKQIRMEDLQIITGPADTRAVTRSQTTGIDIGSGMFSGLAQRIAQRRVDESRPQAERLASARNAARISRTLDQEVERRIEHLRQRLADSMLAQWNESPMIDVRAKSGPGYVLFEVIGPLAGGLGPLPPLSPRDEVAIQVHLPQMNDLLRSQSGVVEMLTDDLLDVATDIEQLKPVAEQVVTALLNNATQQDPSYAVKLTSEKDSALIRARRWGSSPDPATPGASVANVAKRVVTAP